jgi:isoleucyl-tRNA synthetase
VLVYAGDDGSDLTDYMVEIVRDELNVKAFELVEKPERLVEYHVLPNNKLLGPRFGSQFPAVRKELDALDTAVVSRTVGAGKPLKLQVDGEVVELTPDEVLVETRPVEGLTVASDRAVTVAVDSTITSELRAEGLAREFVRRVQSMRKDADYDISDRIRVYYRASEMLAAAVEAHREYIMGEVLATELAAGDPPEGAFTAEPFTFDGEELTVGIVR